MKKHVVTFLVAIVGMVVAYGAIQVSQDLYWLHGVKHQADLQQALVKMQQEAQKAAPAGK